MVSAISPPRDGSDPAGPLLTTYRALDLTLFRNEVTDLDWAYVSPADPIAPGERTGTFRLGDDQLLTAADGTSFISFITA